MKRKNPATRRIGRALLLMAITLTTAGEMAAQPMTPARAINADKLATDLEVTGKGIGIGVFEAGGRPNFAHKRLKMGTGAALMVLKTAAATMADHPCGVVGIIGANEIDAPGRGGIARGSTIYLYAQTAGEKNLAAFFNSFFKSWFNSEGHLWKISNHSYGADGLAGWRWNSAFKRWGWHGGFHAQQKYGATTEDPKFGWYGPLAQQLDLFTSLNKDQITVFSAGNFRGKGPDASDAPLTYNLESGSGGMTVESGATSFPPKNGGASGYDCMEGFKIAKNAITVGSVGYNSGSKIWSLSGFSSTGPTDDGRIKPDVVAFGEQVNVLRRTDDTLSNGTSFAAPAVTAVLAQLAELWKQSNPVSMRSATARALLCHTAKEMGNPGPDYRFGWGKVDALEAGLLISLSSIDNRFAIQERTLKNGEFDTLYMEAPANHAVKVTIAWTDPAGVPVAADNNDVPPLNNRKTMLQNDLDLRVFPITGASDEKIGVPKLPWELNPLQPNLNALRKNNSVDNIEQVSFQTEKVFTATSRGVYMIVVRHQGTLKNTLGVAGSGNSQEYSLIVSGAWRYIPAPRQIVAAQTGVSSSRVVWRSVPGVTGYDVEYRAVGDNTWKSHGAVVETIAQFNAFSQGIWQMRVRGRYKTFPGEWSTPAAFIIGAPPAPTGLNASNITTTSALLRWNAVPGASGYQVAYAPVRADGTPIEDYLYRQVTDTKVTITNLPPDEFVAWFVLAKVAPSTKGEYATGTQFATPINCASYEPENDDFESARVVREGEFFSGLLCTNDAVDYYRIDPFEHPASRYLLLAFETHSKPFTARLYRRDKQSGGFTVSIVANTTITLSPTLQKTIYHTSLDHARYEYWIEVSSSAPGSIHADYESYGFWYETSTTPMQTRRDDDDPPSMSMIGGERERRR